MTPFEAWYGSKPPVHFFRVFGCVAHVKATGGHRSKLDDRSTPMVFIGYEPGSKAYRFYNPNTDRVHISRDAVFDEGRPWNWGEHDDGEHTANSEPFHVEHMTVTVRRGDPMELQEDGAPDGSLGESPVHSTGSQGGTPTTLGTPTAASSVGSPAGAHGGSGPATPASPTSVPAVEFASPPSGEPDLDGEHDDEVPLRFRTLENVLGPAATPVLVEREMDGELMLVVDDEPATFKDARGDEHWRKAMMEEMASIEENDTWVLTDLPQGHRPIGLKWVFKLKRNEQGEIIKHKAWLVTKGYVQQHEIDFDEVFAPVARMESIRTLLAVAA